MVKILFGIILYNQSLEESETFKTLLSSFQMCERINNGLYVYIFDNSPKTKNEEVKEYNYGENIKVKYFSNGGNIGLSKAYNFLCRKAKGFDKIVFLDQDTALPISTYDTYNNVCSSTVIACPKVYTSLGLMSPTYYSNYRSQTIKSTLPKVLPIRGISCINSGMLVDLIFFERMGGYNENLFLDFCDHDFIERIKKSKLVLNVDILDLVLNQDFSAITHNKKQAITRYKLFVKDIKTYAKSRNRLKVFIFVDFPHLLKLSFKYKSFSFVGVRFFNFL